MAHETFLASFGFIGLNLVKLHGIDPEAFARKVGITTPTLPDVRTRLPSTLLGDAFEQAAYLIDEPAFGLRAAECWHPSYLGTLGYAWLSSSSLRKALMRMARYTKILGQRMSSQYLEESQGFRFTFDHGRGDTAGGRAMSDFALSLIISLCRANYGKHLVPAEVRMRRPIPADIRSYEAYFGRSVIFGAPDDSFLLPYPVVDKPLPTSNRELAPIFDNILGTQLAELQDDDLPSRCRAYLSSELTSGEPSDEGLARAMGMGTRTLQRRLAELGLTYRGILEKTRYELAVQYLANPRLSITDVTFLLGFSEQSAFTRAFKRWSGQSPSDYREARRRPLPETSRV